MVREQRRECSEAWSAPVLSRTPACTVSWCRSVTKRPTESIQCDSQLESWTGISAVKKGTLGLTLVIYHILPSRPNLLNVDRFQAARFGDGNQKSRPDQLPLFGRAALPQDPVPATHPPPPSPRATASQSCCYSCPGLASFQSRVQTELPLTPLPVMIISLWFASKIGPAHQSVQPRGALRD